MTLQHSGFSNTQQPSPMPFGRYRAFEPIDLPGPHLADPADHRGAALAVDRPA